MKVRISTVIDVPDEILIKDSELPSAIQIIFDLFTNYAVCQHYADALKWGAKAKIGSPKEDKNSTEYNLYLYHHEAAKQLQLLNWEYEKALPKEEEEEANAG
jgi:hypothetical protein